MVEEADPRTDRLNDMYAHDISELTMTAPMATPDTDIQVEHAAGIDKPWVTIVWDDPVNLMSYVTFVFQRVLGVDKQTAHDLMMQVHNEGKAVVSSGSKDTMENDVRKLQEAGLWASMQQEN